MGMITMTEEAYNRKKKAVGLGVGVVTVLSIATISSQAFGSSITTCNSNQYSYEAITHCSDYDGEICVSSVLANKSMGVSFSKEIENSSDIEISHERVEVQLQINEIRQHISRFDFEEEYEEI
jgi:hypothetical protein